MIDLARVKKWLKERFEVDDDIPDANIVSAQAMQLALLHDIAGSLRYLASERDRNILSLDCRALGINPSELEHGIRSMIAEMHHRTRPMPTYGPRRDPLGPGHWGNDITQPKEQRDMNRSMKDKLDTMMKSRGVTP